MGHAGLESACSIDWRYRSLNQGRVSVGTCSLRHHACQCLSNSEMKIRLDYFVTSSRNITYVRRDFLQLVQWSKSLMWAETLAQADTFCRHSIQSLFKSRENQIKLDDWLYSMYDSLTLTLKFVDSSSSDVPELPYGNSKRFKVA